MNLRNLNPAWLAAIATTSLAAGLLDRFTGPPSDRHALLLAFLILATGLLAWTHLNQPHLALLATLAAAAWSLPYTTHRHLLLTALIPTALLAIPNRLLDRIPRWEITLAAIPIAAGSAYALTRSIPSLLIAGTLAPIGLTLLPEDPTKGTLATLRTTALLLPGALLVLFVPLNAATDWLAQPDAKQALLTGLALAGLLLLASLALLGASTLLESQTPGKHAIFLAAIVALAVAASTAPTKEITLLQAGLAQAVVPLFLLATLAAGRLGARRDLLGLGALASPIVLALAQLGFA